MNQEQLANDGPQVPKTIIGALIFGGVVGFLGGFLAFVAGLAWLLSLG